MVIYEERGVNNGGRSGWFHVCLTDTRFMVHGIGFGFAAINVPIQQLASVVWMRDIFGSNIAVNFIDSDGRTNYFKFIPRHFDRWIAAFKEVGVSPEKNSFS